MPSPDLSDLLASKTLDQWKQSILSTATGQGFNVSNWAEGGFTRSTIALFTQFYKSATDSVALVAAGGFLDFAATGWLTLLAKQVYNVDRIEATFATAANAQRLTNTGGGFYTIDPLDLVFSNGTKTYRNLTGGTLNPGTSITFDLVADEAGSGSSTGVGTITQLVTTLNGVTTTNLVSLVGLDEETDPALRDRCRASIGARSIGGIKKAYEFYAKSATRLDGSSIGVNRVQVAKPPGDGTGLVYLASPSGALDVLDVATIQDIFDLQVSPYGFNAIATNATAHPIIAPCTIYLPASIPISVTDAQQAVYDALAAYTPAVPVGGYIISPLSGRIYWHALVGVIKAAIPGMLTVSLTTESDILIAEGEAPIWTGLLTDTNVVRVAGI